MKKIQNKVFLYLAVIFVFTLIFSLLIPIGGDDWGNFLQKGKSLLEIFEGAKSFYFTWEGRFFSRITLFLLIPHEIIWAFLNASLMTLLFYFMYKILNIDDKYLPLLLMCILFVDFETYSQVYVWRTGNITYFIPMVYAFFLIFVRRKAIFGDNNKIHKLDYLLIPLSLIFCMFTENVAVGIIFICLLNSVYYYLKYKKIDLPMILCLITSIIGFCLMYFSPGTQIRANLESDFTSLSLPEKLLYNIPNLLNFTFIRNSFLTLFFIIIMSIITKRNVKNKVLKWLFLLFIIVPAGITSIVNFISPFITLPNIILKVINSKIIFIDIYWILFIVLFMFLIIYYLKIDKTIWYFIILAIISNGAMMFSPVWGGRTACFTTFMLYMVLLLIIKKLDLKIFNNNVFVRLMNLICITFIILFTIYSVWIYTLNIDRNKYINYQLDNDAKEYEIIILPTYYTWNLNTWGSDGTFAYNFKTAYGIDKEAPLVYVSRKNVNINLDDLNVSSKLRG